MQFRHYSEFAQFEQKLGTPIPISSFPHSANSKTTSRGLSEAVSSFEASVEELRLRGSGCVCRGTRRRSRVLETEATRQGGASSSFLHSRSNNGEALPDSAVLSANLIQAQIRSFSLASTAYSDSLFFASKYRSRSTGNPSPPRILSISSKLT